MTGFVLSIHNEIKKTQNELLMKTRKSNVSNNEHKENDDIARLKKQAEDNLKTTRLMAIDGKLKSGKIPTKEELAYLKTVNYDLYTKAVEVIEERKAYEKRVKNARTKEEVEEINRSKLQSFSKELKYERNDLSRVEQIARRFAGITAEHMKFISSKEYEDLPTRKEIFENEDIFKMHNIDANDILELICKLDYELIDKFVQKENDDEHLYNFKI